jgi:hypothetical protein
LTSTPGSSTAAFTGSFVPVATLSPRFVAMTEA